MLNDIQASGNTFDDWQKAVYNHERFASPEIPTYEGGLSKEIVFNEIVSTAQTTNGNQTQPLGTLASRGMLNHKIAIENRININIAFSISKIFIIYWLLQH